MVGRHLPIVADRDLFGLPEPCGGNVGGELIGDFAIGTLAVGDVLVIGRRSPHPINRCVTLSLSAHLLAIGDQSLATV